MILLEFLQTGPGSNPPEWTLGIIKGARRSLLVGAAEVTLPS